MSIIKRSIKHLVKKIYIIIKGKITTYVQWGKKCTKRIVARNKQIQDILRYQAKNSPLEGGILKPQVIEV